jgi:uncharacterized protein
MAPRLDKGRGASSRPRHRSILLTGWINLLVTRDSKGSSCAAGKFSVSERAGASSSMTGLTLKTLRSKDYRRMLWKNGGGETTEIAVYPEKASLADFDWRISMATVASDGPFSLFPGIDRTLSILEGAGMSLFIEGRKPVVLTAESQPLAFPADAPTNATLVAGTITDLNVMTRRAWLSHEVRRIAISSDHEFVLDASRTLLFCDRGSLGVAGGGETATLSDRDCLLIEGLAGTRLALTGQAQLFAISIRQA